MLKLKALCADDDSHIVASELLATMLLIDTNSHRWWINAASPIGRHR